MTQARSTKQTLKDGGGEKNRTADSTSRGGICYIFERGAISVLFALSTRKKRKMGRVDYPPSEELQSSFDARLPVIHDTICMHLCSFFIPRDCLLDSSWPGSGNARLEDGQRKSIDHLK